MMTTKIFYNEVIKRYYSKSQRGIPNADGNLNISVVWLSDKRNIGYHNSPNQKRGWPVDTQLTANQANGFKYGWNDTIEYSDLETFGFKENGEPLMLKIKPLGLLKSLML